MSRRRGAEAKEPTLYQQMRNYLMETWERQTLRSGPLWWYVVDALERFSYLTPADRWLGDPEEPEPGLEGHLQLSAEQDESIVQFIGHVSRMLKPMFHFTILEAELAHCFKRLYFSLLRHGETALAHTVATRACICSEDRTWCGSLVAELTLKGKNRAGSAEELTARVQAVEGLAYQQRWLPEPMLQRCVPEAFMEAAWLSVGYRGDQEMFVPRLLWDVWNRIRVSLPERYWYQDGTFQPLVPRLIGATARNGRVCPDYQLGKLMVWELCQLGEGHSVAEATAAAKITESRWGSVAAAVDVYWWVIGQKQHNRALNPTDRQNLQQMQGYLERCHCTGT